MRIDDFICLGRTVPEESKRYGLKVCMAGVSEELAQLMRVYPLPIQNPIKARYSCIMELARNPNDCRVESWKLADRSKAIVVSDKPETKEQIIPLLRPHLAYSIEELNDLRKSLGVLEVNGECLGKMVRRQEVNDPCQGMLFQVADEHFGGRSEVAPYLDFFDQRGKHHELQLREWGAHEWIRKYPDKAKQLWDNMGLGGKKTWLVVGNMNNRRTVWLVIKAFTISVIEQSFLPLREMECVGP